MAKSKSKPANFAKLMEASKPAKGGRRDTSFNFGANVKSKAKGKSGS